MQESKQEAIVEGLIYENDIVLLVAPPKMGKTIFAVQLACNISSGTRFLDMLDIPKPLRVMYIATELKDEELKDRFIRTTHKIATIGDNLILICTKGIGFKLNTVLGKRLLDEIITEYKADPPKVVIVDSVYKAFSGSLVRDDIVNEFLGEIDRLAGEFDSAIVLVHHQKKISYTSEGIEIEQGDENTYGSQFLVAAVDHVVRLERIRKEEAPLDRWIKSDSQRSGSIITDVRIRLHEPDPLYFYQVDKYETEKNGVMELLNKQIEPMNIQQIIKRIGIGRTKLYSILGDLVKDKQVNKSGGKVKMFEIKRS